MALSLYFFTYFTSDLFLFCIFDIRVDLAVACDIIGAYAELAAIYTSNTVLLVRLIQLPFLFNWHSFLKS